MSTRALRAMTTKPQPHGANKPENREPAINRRAAKGAQEVSAELDHLFKTMPEAEFDELLLPELERVVRLAQARRARRERVVEVEAVQVAE